MTDNLSYNHIANQLSQFCILSRSSKIGTGRSLKAAWKNIVSRNHESILSKYIFPVFDSLPIFCLSYFVPSSYGKVPVVNNR